MLGRSIYAYVWQTSRNSQIKVCFLASLVAFLSVLPLELQRRIVDSVVTNREVWLLVLLGSIYLAVLLVQGGLKYCLNLFKGRILEEIARDLRQRILERNFVANESQDIVKADNLDSGTAVSILTAESEDVGEFASASLSTPLLQVASIAWVLAYLIWLEPLIAGLALLVYAPQFFLVPKIQRAVNRLARRRTRTLRKLGQEVVLLEGISAKAQARLGKRTGIFVRQIFRVRMYIYRQKYILTFLGNFLSSFGVLIVLVVGGYMVIHDQTSVSTLVVFITGFQKISDPWDQLVNFYRSVSNARVTFGLVADAIDGTEQLVKTSTLVKP